MSHAWDVKNEPHGSGSGSHPPTHLAGHDVDRAVLKRRHHGDQFHRHQTPQRLDTDASQMTQRRGQMTQRRGQMTQRRGQMTQRRGLMTQRRGLMTR